MKLKKKTAKAIAKRVRKTRGGKGKIFIRSGGQNHFNTRESSNTTRAKRRDKIVSPAIARNINRLI